MNYHRLWLAGLVAGVCAASLVPAAHAEYFSRADTHALRSLAVGIGVRSVPVFMRPPSVNPDGALDALAASMGSGREGKVSREKRDDRIRLSGASWHVDVFGDGSVAEFHDTGSAIRAHDLGAPEAMSPNKLEAAGRAYIARNLSRVIVLNRGERLVPEAKAARVEGGVATDGTRGYSTVVANRVVFTREIDGIPVVGAGSKVTLTFLNDGSVESFRYDWPAYVRTGRTQGTVDRDEILRRLQQVVGVRTNQAPPGPVRLPRNISGKQPLDLGGQMKLERLDCGYYDPGLMSRSANAPVQAACYYHVVHSEGSGNYVTTAAYSGAVPAARQAEPDGRWPEAVILRGGKPPALPEAPSAGSRTDVRPVPPRPKL